MIKATYTSLQEKLDHYVEVGKEACSLANETINLISDRLEVNGTELTLQDRVLCGLARKLYHAFESLLEDASRGRSEAMHHLKTFVECFIYLRWAGQKNGDQRAKLLLAKACDSKITFFEKNPNYPDYAESSDAWRTELNNFILGIDGERRQLKKNMTIERLAMEGGLKDIYDRIYRLACEPAHLADLPEYMPLSKGPITADRTNISILWAYVALDYGLFIMGILLKESSEFYKLGIDERLNKLKARVFAVRGVPY